MCSNMLSKTLWCNFTNLVATCYCRYKKKKCHSYNYKKLSKLNAITMKTKWSSG